MTDLSKVTRIEIIGSEGRIFVGHDFSAVTLQLQDDGRTLKLFAKTVHVDPNVPQNK